MILYDDEANGYRYQILPLAHQDHVVKRAVCVVAAFHLSSRIPTLRVPAEGGRDAIIRKLRESACQHSRPDELSWAVVLLLVVGDLITGHEHVLVLYKILSSFNDTHGALESTSELVKFLYYQSRLYVF